MSGKLYRSGTVPKALKKHTDNIRVMQTIILERFLKAGVEKSDNNPDMLFTKQGDKLLDVALKLELKDKQIQAQKELGAPGSNPLLIVLKEAEREGHIKPIDITPKVKELNNIDRMGPEEFGNHCVDIVDAEFVDDDPDLEILDEPSKKLKKRQRKYSPKKKKKAKVKNAAN